MGILINCSCGQTLLVPDDTAGGKFYCWSCGESLSVPTIDSQRPPAKFSANPPKEPSGSKGKSALSRPFTYSTGHWQRIRPGLMVVNFGAGLFFVVTLIVWFALLDRTSRFSLVLTLLTSSAAAVVSAIGTWMCARAPSEAGLRWPAIFAAIFMAGFAIGTVTLCLAWYREIFENQLPTSVEGLSKFLYKLTTLCVQCGFLLFTFFQFIVALSLGERGLAANIVGLHLMPVIFSAVSPFDAPLPPLAVWLGDWPRRRDEFETWVHWWQLMNIVRILWFVVINFNLRAAIAGAEKGQVP